jgi:hypothetical protein
MGWEVLDNKKRIMEIIDYVFSRRIAVSIRFMEEKQTFTSRLLRFKHGDVDLKIGKGPELVIEALVPERGNSLLQSLPLGILEFPIDKSNCRCHVKFLGISNEYSPLGFYVSVPESIEVEEKRREVRVVCNVPEFISAEFTLPAGPQARKAYALNVIDTSLHGVGIAVTQKDFDLLQRLKIGDQLTNLTIYAQTCVIKVDGVVRHITEVEKGSNKGTYIVGIESPEIIESSRE